MPQTEPHKRKEVLKKLINKHNISTGLLSELTGYTRALINHNLNSRYRILNETKYKDLLNAINKIINNDIPPETKGYRIEFNLPSKPNIEAIKNFIKENKIPYKTAASVMGLTSTQLISKLNEKRRSDLSQDFKDEIISKLKKYYNL